jgi:hypothetical protein
MGLQRRCVDVCVESDDGCDSEEVTRCKVKPSMLPSMRCGVVYCEALVNKTKRRMDQHVRCVFWSTVQNQCAGSVMFDTSSACENEREGLTLGWRVHVAKG